MKARKIGVMVLALIITCGVISTALYADHCKKGWGKDGLEEQFYHKAHFLLDNGEELGLSEDQINQIKGLKLNTKKELIKKDAEIEILAIDVQAEMHKETIDKEALHILIDKKYEFKKEKAKSIASAYAALKGLITKEQKEKMKAIWKKCEKENRQYKLKKEN